MKQSNNINILNISTDEEIMEYLKCNPNFNNLRDEFKGKFQCEYQINDWTIIVLNLSGGKIKTYIRPCKENYNIDSLNLVCLFAIRVEKILNKR